MKLRVERDVLAEAAAWTARVLPTRPTLPVLAGLRLDAGSSQLSLSGFDYEVSGRVDVEAEVADEGSALVSGRLLADICRSLPAGRPVDLAADAGKVSLTCGSARFTLLTLPLEDYPELPAMPAAAGVLDGPVLAAAAAQVVVAAGRDDMLPVLTGVRIEIDGETVTLMATDRYRLAVRELAWRPGRPDAAAVALVPARTLAETAKSFGSGEVSLALAEGGQDSLVGFAAGGRRTTTRLLDGEFPKVRSLFPTEVATKARVDTAALIESARRVALVAERNTPLRLSFRPEEVVLEAGSGEDAQASEALPARVEGEPITIGFNPGYLLDGLGALGAPVAHLAFTQATRPAVLSGAADEDADPSTSYRYLIMPVRLSG